MEKVSLTTKDGVSVVADYYAPREQSPNGVLLVHMMPATRVSWHTFAPELEERGYHVLAIDLRGHGESTGGPEGYKQFTDEEHQKSIIDLEAAAEFLAKKGVDNKHLSLVGASIGANLALEYGALHTPKNIILLSPGLNYHGIAAQPFMKQLGHGTRVFFVTSEDDERSDGNDAEMSHLLFDSIPDAVEKKIIVYKEAGHGTDMFEKEEPDLAEEIFLWLTG